MLPAHDVSGLHPLSCFSLSQREAIPSPGQIQRILGESDDRGNLPGLHPIRPVTVIRPSAFQLLGLSNSSPGISRCRGVPNFLFLPLSGQKRSSRISLPYAILASPSFHDILNTFAQSVAESLLAKPPASYGAGGGCTIVDSRGNCPKSDVVTPDWG